MKIIFLLLISIFSLFCVLPSEKIVSLGDWTNETVDTLLFFNEAVSSYQLKPELRKKTVPFSLKERSLPLKGNTCSYAMKSVDGHYYIVATRTDKCGYVYKLITYNIAGENDTEALVVQLNSYKHGIPIDALVLEMNFIFETKHSAQYTVDNSVVKIDRYEVNDFLYAESGDIIGMKDIPDTVVSRSIYKIKDGRFIKWQNSR